VEGYSSGVRLLTQGIVLVLALSLAYGLRNLAGLGNLFRRGGPAAPVDLTQGSVPIS
jgi:hypothetical protein